jgi:cytochrome c oxidase cbb3-type subunit 1
MNMLNKIKLTSIIVLLFAQSTWAQSGKNFLEIDSKFILQFLFLSTVFVLLFFIIKKYFDFSQLNKINDKTDHESNYLEGFNKNQIGQFFKFNKKKCCGNCKNTGACKDGIKTGMTVLLLIISNSLFAQNTALSGNSIFRQPGIIITIILMVIPILIGVIFALIKAKSVIVESNNLKKIKEAQELAKYIKNTDDHDLVHQLQDRKKNLDFDLNNQELSGTEKAQDSKGIIQNISDKHEVHFTALKKKGAKRPSLDPEITKLILWYIGCAAFWLVLGTGIGEYVGIKFVIPEADDISWLSFGRLRPVHTNIVFWGWASLAMIGLGYYVVPTVSNTKIYSIKWGWIALVLTNLMVIFGTICLMSGFNNGGGEFREYVWPVMALFAVALILTLANYMMTVAKRTTKEIYISNWYILSAIIFTIIVALTAYLPFWQDGVSETIVQGYFMHSGVGMWFTLYTLGLLYYFIPQQINKPIYAYSLGILAFWTQIIFYTVIGTHHFIFAPIPWWLQTVAIVGSAGMIIPVVAATINYTMTFKGQWHKVTNSYTLPFFFVAVMYYFIVSMQGTAEAFKYTNLIWHFTDFTVAHAHLGFYGIITFALWGGIYAIVPRLTGIEPKQHLVGAHFWLAFIGLIFYAIPLSIGATLRGLMWMEGKPFIDSVVMMFDWWLWRAIGGSLMFISHLVFFYNFYKMTSKEVKEIDVKEEAFRILEAESNNKD